MITEAIKVKTATSRTQGSQFTLSLPSIIFIGIISFILLRFQGFLCSSEAVLSLLLQHRSSVSLVVSDFKSINCTQP
jgi:hypothetical protein